MKFAKILALLFLPALVLSGCGGGERRFRKTYFGSFDTAVTLIAYAPGDAAFEEIDAAFSARLTELHAIFDRFEPHAGVNGLYALNASGGAWIEIAPELYDLLFLLRGSEAVGRGRVNPALGNLFALWKEYRDAGDSVPARAELEEAAAHADFSTLELADGRARLLDPQMRLALGAVAKGYAAQLLADLVADLCPRFLIDAGGNVVAGEGPEGSAWRVGVRDPNSRESLMILGLAHLSAVTSGDYERYYEVDGVRYHHLIDPATLLPGRWMRQATVIAADSGWADFLSTLLFLSPPAEALQIAEELPGVEAILVLNDGAIQMTSGAGGLVMG